MVRNLITQASGQCWSWLKATYDLDSFVDRLIHLVQMTYFRVAFL